MENRKRHVDAIEEGMAYGKRHKEGREFADSHNFVFRFCFIVFYHQIFLSDVFKPWQFIEMKKLFQNIQAQ